MSYLTKNFCYILTIKQSKSYHNLQMKCHKLLNYTDYVCANTRVDIYIDVLLLRNYKYQ